MGQAGKAQRIRWRGLVWLLPLLCAVWVARLIYLRRGPECFPVPEAPDAIHDGRLYWISGPSLVTAPVTGGPLHTIVQEDPKYQIAGLLTFSRDSILYSIYPKKPNPGLAEGVLFRSQSKIKYLGAYRAVSGKTEPQQTASEKRLVLPKNKHPASVSCQRSVPLQGGVPHNYAPDPDGTGIQIGAAIYYVRQRPDDTVRVTSGNTTWDEIAGHSDLIATSLADGSSRTLDTGLSMNTILMAGQNGVFWIERRPYPDNRNDLYYYRATDGKIYVLLDYLPGYRGGMPFTPPIEFQERLYWYLNDSSDYGLWSNARLVSARLDGSDQRELYGLAMAKRVPIPWGINPYSAPGGYLQVYRGRLYCLLGVTTYVGIWDMQKPSYLCRIRPEHRDPIEDIATLPEMSNHFLLDGGYLYFVHEVEHRPFLDMLTGDDSHIQKEQTLCRIRLPD